jgi:tRNA pseudouridine55 synthase
MTVLETRPPGAEASASPGEFLLVDKPKAWTSFDVVHKIRRAFRVRRVGHAGTLDPLATGLLIVCTGRKTREIETFQHLEKEYEALMELGARTPSYDAETEIIERRGIEGVTADQVRETLARFVGPQRQIPPLWSAVKVKGKRLYEYARRGEPVERKPREVTISSIVPTRIDLPLVAFTVVCSKGTYVRTLVDDIGASLGCGAYLRELRRTRIGGYHVRDARTVEELVRARREERENG